MRRSTRKLLDHAFSGVGFIAIAIMAASVLIVLVPIYRKGTGAFIFRATAEHRRLLLEKFGQGDPEAIRAEQALVAAARQPAFDMITAFEAQLKAMPSKERRNYRDNFKDFDELVHELPSLLEGARSSRADGCGL